MKFYKRSLIGAFILYIMLTGCKSINKTQAGAELGTAGGGVIGEMIGKASGNASQGVIIGANVGGVTGAVIGKKMDKQAEEIKKQVPNAKVERVGEGIAVEFNSKILFASGQANLSASSEKKLNELGKVLLTYPDTNIEIQGHTDNTGKDSDNQALSEGRANAVAGYLNNKISSKRITTKGFGATAPKYTNDTEKGRTENRRVDFLITANEKMKEEAQKEAEKIGK